MKIRFTLDNKVIILAAENTLKTMKLFHTLLVSNRQLIRIEFICIDLYNFLELSMNTYYLQCIYTLLFFIFIFL